jgi:membrane protein required for beta-lactamase induction
MTFLAVLLALAVDRFLGSLQSFRRWDWLLEFRDRLAGTLAAFGWWRGPTGVVITVAVPLLAITLAHDLLGDVFGPLGFLFATAVLLFSMGPRCLHDDVEAYLDARGRGSAEAACFFAERVSGHNPADDAMSTTGTVAEGILVEANERVFAVIFWFVVLGPVGAALYRMSGILREAARREGRDGDGYGRAASWLHAILAWAPARLTAVGYALSGDFMDALSHWRDKVRMLRDDHERLLITCGLGALQLDPGHLENPERDDETGSERRPVPAAFALVKRTLGIWLAALALMTLSGWIF